MTELNVLNKLKDLLLTAVDYLCLPFTLVPQLITGLTRVEVEHIGQLQQIAYRYRVNFDEVKLAVSTPLPQIDTETSKLYEAVKIEEIYIKDDSDEGDVYVKVYIETIAMQDKNLQPVTIIKYPIYLALFYATFVFSALCWFTYVFPIGLSTMIYFIILAAIPVVTLFYLLLAKRYVVTMPITEKEYTARDLVEWFKEYKNLFIDVERLKSQYQNLPRK